ncbi:argininosuccinate lyase, partial [candidate division NPL-UPA2 bacterium]|nr:argininosuccinate lyase [candidate division NPL-UPA2 bacterium]
EEVEKFTVGDDYLLDRELIEADVLGSLAHARMLTSLKILTVAEFKKLKKALLEILHLWKEGKFTISSSDEDVHTAIENYLTKKLGDLGKKIHTARSRNDQVIVDLRIYAKDKLLHIEESLLIFCQALRKFCHENRNVPMPGYTHSRQAMPSSVALWAGAFLESLLDDLILLKSAYEFNDQCPLGSAASYGVPLSIDRQLTSDLLGFKKVQNNVLYVNNSRGKVEAIILSALSQVMLDLGRLAEDLILFTREEFNYFTLPDELCPGSSIMPQKKNPAPLEIIRGKSNLMASYLFQVMNMVSALSSGYHQDLQLTKEPLLRGLEIAESSLKVSTLVISRLKVNKDALKKAFTAEIFATDEAYKLVEKGMSFRDAYRQVAKDINHLKPLSPEKSISSRKHLGAAGNLGLESLEEKIKKELEILRKAKEGFEKRKRELTA